MSANMFDCCEEKKAGPVVGLDYKSEYERLEEKYDELHLRYCDMRSEQALLTAEAEKMRCKLEMVYLIFGGGRK